jgi:uridine kinase
MSRLPVISLDDFYRDGTAREMPRHSELGIIDWDDPRAWNAHLALETMTTICRDGEADVPVYDISQDRAVSTRRVSVGASAAFVAEGLFAGELVEGCRKRGILADAIVVSRAPWKNFARRLSRDLVERRKPPLTLVRRGRALMATEREVVARQVALGCRPCDATDVYEALATVRAQFS